MSDRKTIILKKEDLVIPKNITRKKRSNADDTGGRIRVKTQQKREQSTMKKRSILRMIREHQEEKYRKMYEKDKKNATSHGGGGANKGESNEFDSDFKKSLEYLSKISEEQKTKVPTNNTTLKHYGGQFASIPTATSSSLSSSLSMPPSSSSVSVDLNTISPGSGGSVFQYGIKPQYSSMKGGSMPTYRIWRQQQTQKNMSSLGGSNSSLASFSQPTTMPPPPSPIQITSMTGGSDTSFIRPELKGMIESRKINERLDTLKRANVRPRMKQKKTIRRTFKLGKSKTFSQVSVLVSNKNIRSNILTKTQQLKTIPIDEIKKFLIKRGFIKVGSTAPNDVLRKMYESVVLICGEVNNHNMENLYHNYLNGGL